MTITQQQVIALAVEAGMSELLGPTSALLNSEIACLHRFAAMVAQQERNACLAEIETGIWIDKTTEEVLAEIADAIRARNEPCRFCNGTGERDSGGSQPWGAAIMVECECQQSDDAYHRGVRDERERCVKAFEKEADSWTAWPQAGAAKRKGVAAIYARNENANSATIPPSSTTE